MTGSTGASPSIFMLREILSLKLVDRHGYFTTREAAQAEADRQNAHDLYYFEEFKAAAHEAYLAEVAEYTTQKAEWDAEVAAGRRKARFHMPAPFESIPQASSWAVETGHEYFLIVAEIPVGPRG